MSRKVENSGNSNLDKRPHKVRLPGFIGTEEVGLGDLMQRATSYLGIRSCSGCEKRRHAINRWLAFHNGHRR